MQIPFYGFGKPIPISRAENFAEYMNDYYLAHDFRQPYRIELFKKGRLVFEHEPMRSARVLRRASSVLGLIE